MVFYTILISWTLFKLKSAVKKVPMIHYKFLVNMKTFLAKCWVILPLPSRCYAWVNLGSNFKNVKNMLLCISNYSLLRIRKMYIFFFHSVWLRRYSNRSSGVIFSTTSEWMTYHIVRLVLYVSKIYTFKNMYLR